MSQQNISNQNGMTKIEILIVAAIIGILGSISVLVILDARAQARDAVRISDIRQVQTGLELLFNDFNKYPELTEPVAIGQSSAYCLNQDGFSPTCDRSSESVYIEAIAAPLTAGLNGLSECGIRNSYCYKGFEDEYRITFELEQNQPVLGLRKGLNCATETGFESGKCPELSHIVIDDVDENEVAE